MLVLGGKVLNPKKGTQLFVLYSVSIFVLVTLVVTYFLFTGVLELPFDPHPRPEILNSLLSIWKFFRNIGYFLSAILLIYIVAEGVSQRKKVTAVIWTIIKTLLALVLLTFSYPLGSTLALFIGALFISNIDKALITKNLWTLFIPLSIIFVILPLFVIFLVKLIISRGNKAK